MRTLNNYPALLHDFLLMNGMEVPTVPWEWCAVGWGILEPDRLQYYVQHVGLHVLCSPPSEGGGTDAG